MKQLLRFKTFLLMAVLSLLAGTSAWAETETITFSELDLSNSTQYSKPFTSGDVSVTFAGGQNDGKYYTTGQGIRTYSNGTITIGASGNTITSIALTFAGENYAPSSTDVWSSNGTGTGTSGVNASWSGNASQVVLTRPSGSGHWRLQSVAVTYETGGGSSTLTDNNLALTGDPVALSFDLYNNATAQVINYTTSSTGEVTVADNDYATFVVDQTNKTITVTPTAETPSTQTITVIQAPDDTYAAGSVTFTLDITDSTPVGDVSEDVIDFTTQSYTNQQTIEKFEADGCTISFDKGTNSNAPKYFTTGTAIRAYGGNTFTVTSTCGKSISEIIITFGNSDGSNEITANVGTYSDGTWTGDAESVTFTIGGTSGNRRIAGIKVTYADAGDTRVATTTTFPQASYAIELGDEFTAPTATVKVGEEEVTGAEVTYSGDNDALAAVDATTGSLTFVDGATGEINVTATYAGDETNYKGSTGTYTLTVTDPNGPGTENNPYTVAEARAAIDAGTGMTGVYAKGIVSKIVTAYNSQYGNITYNISADGTTTADQLQAYRGKSYNGEDFTSEDDIQVGDEVVVYGNLKKYGETYEFDTNNQLVSLKRPVVSVPTIGLSTTTVNAEAAGANGTIDVTYANFTAANPGIELFEADGTTSATYDWLTASFDDDATIVYSIQENTTTEARTAYFKAYAMNGETKVYSDLVTVAQAGVVIDYATLPFSFDGGKADVEGTNGLTHEGLGSDYSTAPKLKFDTTGDVLVLKFNERPGKLTFDIKGNSFSGGTFTVQTSEDGVNYTDLRTYTELSATQSEMFNKLGENVRYIKWVYTEKSSGNVALGNIALEKYTDTPVVVVAAPTFDPAGMEVEAGFVVTITSEVGTVISYTTDGTDPAVSETAVLTDTNTASVEVNADMTIRAIALDNDLNQSVEVSESYTVAAPVVVVGVPVITVDNGLITIVPGSDNAQVIYTTDGTVPTYEPLNGTVYTEPFNITVDTTIKAIGVDNNGNVSEVVTIEASAEVVVGVKYYKVTSTDQLEEGVDYLLVYEGVAGEGAAAYGGLNSYTNNSYGKSVELKHIGGSVVTITDEEVVPVTLKSRSEDGTKWAMRDATGWIAAINGNNLHGNKSEDDAVWTFDFTAEAHKQIFHEFSGNIDTRYLEYNTNNPRFAGYTGTQSAVYLYKAATYNVSVGATGYATLYYGTKNLVVPENVEAYTYTVKNGKLEESYLYSTNEVIPAGTGVVLKAPAGEYKFAVTTEAGLEDTDNLLFGFDTPSTTVAPAAGDYLFYLLGVDNGKVGFYWGKAEGAAFKSGAHKAYLAVPTEQASGLRGFSFDGSVVGINTIGVDMPEGNAYDLQGRRVQQLQKNGLYIVDGKKMLAK